MLKIIPYSSIISVSQIKSIFAVIAVFSYTIYTSVNTADNVVSYGIKIHTLPVIQAVILTF